MITGVLHAITDAATSRRGKFLVLLLWLLAAGLLSGIAPKLASLYNESIAQQIPTNDDSQVAQRLLLAKFPSSRGTPAILALSDAGGLTIADRLRARQMSEWLTSAQKPAAVSQVISVFTVPQAAEQLVSPDGTTMTMVITLNGSANDPSVQQSVQAIRAKLKRMTAGSSLQGSVTGPAGLITDLVGAFSSTDVTLLLATIGLVLVLLILLYRSPLLALLPLLAVGVVLQVVNALLALAGRAGFFSISQTTASIATVLLFGAGTDYSIFIASRFHEELQQTQDKHQAMRTTMRAVGEAITSSAGTVILGLLTLLTATIGIYSALGPTLAVAIVVMLLAGLTLVPALLTCFGRVAYWPFIPHISSDQAEAGAAPLSHSLWGWLGRWTARHRVAAVVGSTSFLLLLALGNLGSQLSFNLLTAFRTPTDATNGYAILQQHFPAGTLAPTTVLIQLRGASPDAYQHLSALDAVTAAAGKVPGVAGVQGPTRPNGKPSTIPPAQLQANIAALPPALKAANRSGQPLKACTDPGCPPSSPQLAGTIGAYAASTQYISSDNTTIQLSVVFSDDPYALPAINRIAVLRSALSQALSQNGLGPNAPTSATVHLAGQTALLADTASDNQRDLFLIVPAVLLLVALVLGVLLRSLIAPLYLLAAVTLNFFAALGLSGFVFQRLEGQEGFYYAIPLYTFVFLVALGADYTIFLMSRVREEAQQRGLEVGVPLTVARTGGVITSAGIILAGTFAVLTTLPITLLYQFGVCVAVRVLLDTFIVRGLLVPGVVLLLGRWNWWPSKLQPTAGHDPVRAAEAAEAARGA